MHFLIRRLTGVDAEMSFNVPAFLHAQIQKQPLYKR